MSKSPLKKLISHMREYCSRSSIHGFQYILEKNRTYFERIFWFSIIFISLTACLLVIHGTYETWNENAVGVTLSNKKKTIYDIPFPAVTICTPSKIPKFKCEDHVNETTMEYAMFLCKATDSITRAKARMSSYYKDIEHCLDKGQVEELDSRLGNMYSIHETEKFYSFMETVKPKFQFHWFGFNTGNQRVDTSLVTSDGICYTVNMISNKLIFKNDVEYYFKFERNFNHTTDWSFDMGYNKSAEVLDSYPRRQAFLGIHGGLKLAILTSKADLDNCAEEASAYNVYIHDPSSVPGSNNFKLLLNESKRVVLNPTLIIASDAIKKYSAENRACYFQNEKKLQYFEIYTLANCQMECWTNYSLALCGCVHFSMPRKNGTAVCGLQMEFCASKIAKDMATSDKFMTENNLDFSQAIYKFLKEKEDAFTIYKGENASLNYPRCNCLSTCADIDYKTEISQNNLPFEIWAHKTDQDHLLEDFSHVSTLEIYFDQNEFTTFERKELYGPLDFLANFGGLLGLFCGFSLLSFIEILYFLTIRVICNQVLHGHWTGDD